MFCDFREEAAEEAECMNRCIYTLCKSIYISSRDVIATVQLYRILQLAFFSFRSITRTSIHLVMVGIQTMPSTTALTIRSTRNQRGNCDPITATVRFYCILQLGDFGCCPFTRTSNRLGNVGIQDNTPSVTTLFSRSTRN
jgi:hypothetical protein